MSSHMQRALAQAELALYLTSPNPRVGCVISRGDLVLGEGHTQAAGSHHAEVMAVRAALSNPASAGSLRGATAHVTLEPCAHQGRTPPCVDLLIEQGLAGVEIALRDPNPLVAGKGIEKLRGAGVNVSLLEESNPQAQASRELNLGFFKRMTQGLPWVRLKAAASLDGFTALASGESQWITGAAARRDGHHFRACACAILTGIGTVQADDPQLTVREVHTPRQPRRILLDSRLQAPLSAKLFQGESVRIFSTVRDKEKQAALEALGHVVSKSAADTAGKLDLGEVLGTLAKDGVNELHVEAGAKLSGSFIQGGHVDELLIYLAPQLLGGGLPLASVPSPAALGALESWRKPYFHSHDRVGDDLRFRLRYRS